MAYSLTKCPSQRVFFQGGVVLLKSDKCSMLFAANWKDRASTQPCYCFYLRGGDGEECHVCVTANENSLPTHLFEYSSIEHVITLTTLVGFAFNPLQFIILKLCSSFICFGWISQALGIMTLPTLEKFRTFRRHELSYTRLKRGLNLFHSHQSLLSTTRSFLATFIQFRGSRISGEYAINRWLPLNPGMCLLIPRAVGRCHADLRIEATWEEQQASYTSILKSIQYASVSRRETKLVGRHWPTVSMSKLVTRII